jgi:hypothetical protein
MTSAGTPSTRNYFVAEAGDLAYLWPQCHLVQDIDDTRQTRHGVYYTQKKAADSSGFGRKA